MTRWTLGLLAALMAAEAAAGAISLDGVSSYSENFDTLANSPVNNTSTILPFGWAFAETGTNAETTYSISDGSSNAGNTYSYGSGVQTDRALGALQSGSLIPLPGVNFLNNSGQSITALVISYVGEQWRLGESSRVSPDRLDFQWSTDAVSLTTGTWNNFDALDFVAPVSAGTIGALNGNLAANQQSLLGTLTGLSIGNGTYFWLRWTDYNVAAADDGLAIDNFSLTARTSVDPPAPVPLPATAWLLLSGLGGLGFLRKRKAA